MFKQLWDEFNGHVKVVTVGLSPLSEVMNNTSQSGRVGLPKDLHYFNLLITGDSTCETTTQSTFLANIKYSLKKTDT